VHPLVEERRHGAGPILVIVILAVGAAAGLFFGWWLPGQARERMARNERAATLALKSLATAEPDFRSNDRDGNRVQDLWVADAAGLYVHGKLIDRSIAEADARPLVPMNPAPIPRSGYFFIAMEFDGGESGSLAPYGQDTDGTGRKVHNPSAFAFCAYPAVYGVTGRNTFIISEGNTIFKYDTGGAPMIRWPLDQFLKADYEKID